MTTATVSVIIPAFNEARTIGPLLRKIASSSSVSDIIVINNGSTDDTAVILERLQQELPFRVVTQQPNRGKGTAVSFGLQYAQGQIVLIQDADDEYDPVDYPLLLKPLIEGRAAVVYGSRFLGAHRVSSPWHRFENWAITALVNALFNATLTDVATGYKVFRRDVMMRCPLRASGFEFDLEVTCKLLRMGHTIVEVPVSYRRRSYAQGKKITWRDGIYALWVILCCRLDPHY